MTIVGGLSEMPLASLCCFAPCFSLSTPRGRKSSRSSCASRSGTWRSPSCASPHSTAPQRRYCPHPPLASEFWHHPRSHAPPIQRGTVPVRGRAEARPASPPRLSRVCRTRPQRAVATRRPCCDSGSFRQPPKAVESSDNQRRVRPDTGVERPQGLRRHMPLSGGLDAPHNDCLRCSTPTA